MVYFSLVPDRTRETTHYIKQDPLCASVKQDPLCAPSKQDPLCVPVKQDPLCTYSN